MEILSYVFIAGFIGILTYETGKLIIGSYKDKKNGKS
jgi:hypothetical protein